MSIFQIALLTLYAAGMSLGQALFKSVAVKIAPIEAHTYSEQISRMMKIAFDPLFFLAMLLYLCICIFWVWLLSFIPLSRAYPFGALAFVFTIMIGAFFFQESVTRMHLLGLTLILSGIIVIAQA